MKRQKSEPTTPPLPPEPPLPMDLDGHLMMLEARALETAKERLSRLLDENFAEIFATFRQVFTAWCLQNPDKKPSAFKFPVSMSTNLRMIRGDMAVSVKAAWGIRRKAQVDDALAKDPAQPELDFEAAKPPSDEKK